MARTVTCKSKYLIMKGSFVLWYELSSLSVVTILDWTLTYFVICDYLAQGWSNCDLWATSSPQSYCENLTVTLLLICINIFLKLKLKCLLATASTTICHTNVATNDICYAHYTVQLINKYLNILCWLLASPAKYLQILIQPFGCEVCPSLL
jgi:hypothetical protein